MEELLEKLKTDLEVELSFEVSDNSNKVLLFSKIKAAYYDVKYHRNYQEHHTEEFIDKDMLNLYPVIRQLALFDWNMIGAEGQVSMSENGTSRTWVKRDEILSKVIPFVQVL